MTFPVLLDHEGSEFPMTLLFDEDQRTGGETTPASLDFGSHLVLLNCCLVENEFQVRPKSVGFHDLR